MPELRLPRHVESVGTACSHAEAVALEAGWPAEDVTRVTLAIGEAVANAVEHGGGDGPEEVRVDLDLRGRTLSVCVSDGGPGPSPQRLDEARLPHAPLATSGRGLYILQHVADSVYVDDQGGLCLTIRSSG